MEMQQEFHCVNIMNGNGKRELSSTTAPAPSTPPNSSSQTLPATNFSVSSPQSLPPPARRPPQTLTREQALKSLRESIPHSIKLRQLHQSERAHQKVASSYKKAVRRLSKELYMIVSLYALLQGALFTAVAQSSVFDCADWWGPAGFVGAVTVGTISAVLKKLRRMGQQKQEVKKFERRQRSVYSKIELLYLRGAGCSIESLEPEHTERFNEADQAGDLCIFSAQGLLVLGFLVGFSALIMASCTQMLCLPCHCKQ